MAGMVNAFGMAVTLVYALRAIAGTARGLSIMEATGRPITMRGFVVQVGVAVVLVAAVVLDR